MIKMSSFHFYFNSFNKVLKFSMNMCLRKCNSFNINSIVSVKKEDNNVIEMLRRA